MDDTRNRTLWCGNLDPQVTEDLLYELFTQAGPLESVTIPKESGGRQKSFAFVTFWHEESVGYTLALMEGVALFGKTLKLQRRPEALVDNTYIDMMTKHRANVAELRRRHAPPARMPSPTHLPPRFRDHWSSHPPTDMYDWRYSAHSAVPDGKYNRHYHPHHRALASSSHDHYTKRRDSPPSRHARRRDERHPDNSHRRRHTNDPYRRCRN